MNALVIISDVWNSEGDEFIGQPCTLAFSRCRDMRELNLNFGYLWTKSFSEFFTAKGATLDKELFVAAIGWILTVKSVWSGRAV